MSDDQRFRKHNIKLLILARFDLIKFVTILFRARTLVTVFEVRNLAGKQVS